MTTTQLLVRRLLEQAEHLEWSIQGMGMLRHYLSREVRLHIWDSRFRVPNVSTIHDHPWDFESEIVCGSLVNRFYYEIGGEPTHTRSKIRCGVGGGLVHAEHCGEERPVRLHSRDVRYAVGERYHEVAEALHETLPEDGTVTLVTRKFRPDTEHALVCYPIGTSWVSAEPRKATHNEVYDITRRALERLNGVGQ